MLSNLPMSTSMEKKPDTHDWLYPEILSHDSLVQTLKQVRIVVLALFDLMKAGPLLSRSTTTYKYSTEVKIRISSQTRNILSDSLLFSHVSHSNCGSPPVKM